MKKTLPFTFHKINKLLDDPKASIMEIARIIATEPALKRRFIGLLRYCELPPLVWDARSAVRLLGTEGVRWLVMEHYTPPILLLKKPPI